MRWTLSLLLLVLPAAAVALQPAEAVAAAYANVQRVPPADRPYTRYLWVSTADPKIAWQTWVACSGQANGMSTGRRIVPPVLILRDGTERAWPAVVAADWSAVILLRLRITDYGWLAVVFDRLGDPALEPLFHVYTTGEKSEKIIALAPWLLEPLGLPAAGPERDKALATFAVALLGLVAETRAATPIVEADNFVWQTAIQFDRRAGYYDFLGVTDLKSFQRVVGFDEKSSIDFAFPLLEAVKKSGVSTQPRRIEVYEKIGGRFVATKDQVNQRGLANRNPLITLGRRDLLFDATEIFASLPNGWWATFLANNLGVRQDSAPDGVGYNHRAVTNDGKIHVNLTCLVCHDSKPGRGGMQSFKPFFREQYVAPGPLALASITKSKFATNALKQEYLSLFDLSADQARYVAAAYQATGLTPDKYAEALLDSFLRWDRAVSLRRAAVFSGVTEADMVKGLDRQLHTFGVLGTVNADWLKADPEPTPVDQWAESFNEAQLALRGYPSWPAELRKKIVLKGAP